MSQTQTSAQPAAPAAPVSQVPTNTPKKPQNAVQVFKGLIESPAYFRRIEHLLKERAPQFCASLAQLFNSTPALQKCEPNSIFAAALIAAALDLPIEKNLGFAHIVPYGTQAQFQLGYKGYIQLGLRTNQYKQMNACGINAEAWGGYDDVGDPLILWKNLDPAKPSIGFVFAFKLISGFTKVVYWSRERAMAHAMKYSKSFAGGYDSVWKTNPDSMCLKTTVRDGMSHWGIMSVQIQRALTEDYGSRVNTDAPPSYPDGMAPQRPQIGAPAQGAIEVGSQVVTYPEPGQTAETPPAGTADTAEKAKRVRRTKAQIAADEAAEAAAKAQSTQPPDGMDKPAEQTPAKPVAQTPPGDVEEHVGELQNKLATAGVQESKCCSWAAEKFHLSPCSTLAEMNEIAPARISKINNQFEELKAEIIAFKPQ